LILTVWVPDRPLAPHPRNGGRTSETHKFSMAREHLAGRANFHG